MDSVDFKIWKFPRMKMDFQLVRRVLNAVFTISVFSVKKNCRIFFSVNSVERIGGLVETHSELNQTSKMDIFVKIVNG